MSNASIQTHYVTLDEYLAWEEKQEERYEFVDGVIRAMAGASYSHNTIVVNLTRRTANYLDGKPCYVLTTSQKVRSESNTSVFYPDIGIHCGKPVLGKGNTLFNTVAIFEILSPSTERYDRTKKFHHYQQIETLREYFLVYQDAARIEAYRRTETGWEVATYSVYVGLGAVLPLESVGISIPLTEIYENVELEELADQAEQEEE